jgi:anaerobic ribonucleoside-triphosphate reductase activating protein
VSVRIHEVMPVSEVNGPGRRFVLWAQGCSRHCPGCFNPATHAFEGGYLLSAGEIAGLIPVNEVSGITVSGGEPFEQAGELASVLEAAAKLGLNRMVYTGYTYEELAGANNKKTAKCLSLIDILVDGAYREEEPAVLPWTGSRNQRALCLAGGKIAGTLDTNEAGRGESEIVIDPRGNITVTGIVDSGVYARRR